MLKTFHIKNFALIDSVELEFSPNLNIITGETGAGKSIIIDALMIALGERASNDYIRTGEKKAIIEAIFQFPKKHKVFKFIKENGYECENNEVILRREISLQSSTRSFLNDSPISASLLKQFGDSIIDFHGQYDHQLLLHSDSHISLLDDVAGLDEDLEGFRNKLKDLKNLIHNYENLCKKEKEFKLREESHKYELNEINKLDPKPNEENILEEELTIKENSELLLNLISELYGNLYEEENCVLDKLKVSNKLLENLVKIDNSFKTYLDELASAAVSINEISKFANNYKNSISLDSERIEEIRERLLLLKGLRKKYGSFEEIFNRKNELEINLNLIENFEDEIKKLQNEIFDSKTSLGTIANEISIKREKFAISFESSIVAVLKNLGINEPNFKVNFQKEIFNENENHSDISSMSVICDKKEYAVNDNGIDIIEFYISANKGEDVKPLASIASGGEISRVMLALKSVLAESVSLPVLVFDEIDSGISGRVGRQVGITMKKLAKKHQIIAITHLPQIASLADLHINVVKIEQKDKTVISAKKLNEKEIVNEIAKMLSGSNITDTSIKSAKELINEKI
jgi:DNA repair protein RecN (Recombination protein N)